MTWVIGTPTMFGYGFGISDVRVTLGDGSEIDCLQKIHGVGRYVALGFAGSVKIGFDMLETLSRLMQFEDDRISCDPLSLAQMWPDYAKSVFSKSAPEDRLGGSDLLVISAHPQEHTGNPSWPRSYVHIFKSPDFQTESIPVHTIGSIGCGSDYGPCREAVESFSDDFRRRELFTQGEVRTPGGMGTLLGSSLTQLLIRTRPGGISSHLHYCWVYRGQIIIKTNDHTQKGRWSILEHGSGVNRDQAAPIANLGQSAIEDGADVFHMPRLAATWEQLVKILDTKGAQTEGCVA